MGVFHEIHCDASPAKRSPDCVSDQADGPFAWTLREARKEAKKQGWVFRKGDDYCPNCFALASMGEKTDG